MAITKEWNGTKTKILICTEKGMSGQEIAKRVGVHPSTVSVIQNQPEFIAKKMKLDADRIEAAREILKETAIKAALKIAKIAVKGKPEDRIQLDAAKEILHMIGLKPIEVIENRKREYSKEELESASLVAKELEAITERLTGHKSHFLVAETTEEPQLSAPVPAMLPESENIEETGNIADK